MLKYLDYRYATCGVISGTYDADDETADPYSVTVTATDAKFGASQNATFSLVLYSPSTPAPNPNSLQLADLQNQIIDLNIQQSSAIEFRDRVLARRNGLAITLTASYMQYATAMDVQTREVLAWADVKTFIFRVNYLVPFA